MMRARVTGQGIHDDMPEQCERMYA